MNDNDILINIKANIQGIDDVERNINDLNQSAERLPEQFSDVRESVKSLFQEFQTNMGQAGKGYFDYLPKQMESSINSMIRAMQDELKTVKDSVGGIVDGKQIGETVTKDIEKSMAYLTANMKTMFSSAGSVGRIFSGISENMKKEFTANLSDMSRDIVKLVQRVSYSSGMGAQSDSFLQRALMRDKGFSAGYSSFGNRFGLTHSQQDQLLKGLIQASTPAIYRQDYIDQLIKTSNGQIKRVDTIPTYSNFKERLPERFRNIPDRIELSSMKQARSQQMYQGNLTQAEYNIIKNLAKSNPTWEQALTMAGVATRGIMNGRAGSLIMPEKPISKLKYAQALGYLDKDLLRPSLEGSPMYYRSIAGSNYKDQITIANKSSTVPKESFGAFYELRGIDVDPLYMKKPSNVRYNVPQNKSVVVSSGANIRPNQYQIMSLTYDDFVAGKFTDASSPKRNIFDDRQDNVSVNKMIQQSLYTDLLGMFGHQTYGNGSKTKIGLPKMLQLNLADRIYQKDASGGLLYGENGIPLADEKTLELVSSLFKQNKTVTLNNGKTYSYPSISYGKNGTYVPTNIKNGIITLAEESAYLKASMPFLNKYGVNVFDNLVSQGVLFDSTESLNKPIEARNRMLTPGVPFSQLGGTMPNKDKIAFVDLETLTGHNGSSFFMPGFLPGGDLTLRSVGIKGLGQTVDFKKMIRDIYGQDTESFYVPFMNAPENMKKLFMEQGIDAVRAAYQNETTRSQNGLTGRKFEEDFLNAMNYDALFTASMIKTPMYKDLKTNSDVAELFYDVLGMTGGMRGVKSASDFHSIQRSLSQQVSRNLLLSPEEAAANQEKWSQYINDLMHNPSAIKKYLFSDPDDELSKRVQADESLLFSDNEAKNRINEALVAARISQMYNEIYSPGNLSMRVALANPGEQILKLGAMNRFTPANTKLAKILGLGYNETGKDIVSIPGLTDSSVGGLRYPNNVTEQFILELSDAYSDLVKNGNYGMNKDGIYLNMSTIAKMGGGDVDGDTVQIIQGNLAEIVKKTFEDRKAKLGGYKAPNLKKSEQKFDQARTQSEQDFADLLYRQATASFQMGAVENAAKALEQGNWDDPTWVNQVARGSIDLKAMYDIDSTFQKSGILADWTAYANRARQMGRPFSSVFKDMQGAVNEGDYSRLGNFSKINFPSAYNALTVSMLNSLKNNPMSNEALETMIKVQSDLQGIPQLLASGDPINIAKAKFLNKNNDLFAQLLTGRGQALATSSVEDLGLLLGQWSAEIEKAAPFAKYDKAKSDFIDQQRKEYQAQLNRYNHLNQFGLTQARIERGEGYGASKLFSNARYTDDPSAYYTAKAKEDEAALQAAIVSGAHPMVVESLANSSEAELGAIAAAKARADSRTYSWSMINTLQHGASGPENWYKQYIQDIKQPETRETLLGSAAHAALEAWATNRKNNNSNYGTSEEYEKAVNDYLLKNKGLFPELPTTGSSANFTQRQVETYQNILAFARNLPNLFRDEQIVGFEKQGGEIHPNFGYRRSSPNERLNSIGYIDLITRDAEGNLIKTDLKPRLSYPRVWEQLDTYNPERDARYKRVLSYGERDYSDPSKYIEKKEYKEEEIAKTEAEMQQVVSRIQDFAALGNPISQLTQTFADVIRFDGAGSTGNTFSQLQSRRQHIFDEMTYQQQEEDIAKQEQDQVFKDYEQDRLEISKNTGVGIAKAMALQTDMHDYVKQLDEMTSSLASRGRKLQDPKKLSDMWAGYEYQLDELFNRRKLEFQARGASDAEIGLLDQSRNAALSQLEATRSIAAYSDIDQLTQSLSQKIQENNTSSPIRNYVKEFNDLAISIEKATQAYSQLQEDINKKKENNTPITEDELKNLEKAEASNVVMHQTADQYRQLLSENLSKQIQQHQDSILQTATGQPLSIEQTVERQAASLAASINKQRSDLTLLHNNKLLDDNQFGAFIKELESISIEDYKNKLIEDRKLLEEQQRIQKDAQINQFINHGKQIQLSALGQNRNDFFSRTERQQASILSQYGSYINSGENQIKQLERELITKPKGSDEYKKITEQINTLKTAVSQASTEMQHFQGASGLANVALMQIGVTAQHVITQFGRRMFQKAIQETKRFVQEYDKDMTTIQMITLKSDSEIGSLGQNLIQKAVDMRASVSETTSAAAELYRQGLSDEEVDTRLEDVIKFSKVAGIKTTEASKIITTALQNGLVDTSEEAMDALVALGDSAATTASEIAKGMQKTAASAKQAGVSYSQLVTLLTIGTSKTQLGGSSIGSALQTLFYRLQKVGKNEDFYDENGRHIASNDAMKAMDSLGVSAFDDAGNMRNPYDVLVDIASRWDTADDVTQSKLLTSLGAGRQRSNVATLLQGLAEDNGELANKYNDLASNSEGITDKKYQEYLKSLEAAITNVRTSFDQLISTFNAGATASTVLNFLATLIQGFTKVNDMLGGIPTLLSAIGVAAAGLIALFKFSSPIGWLSVGLGAAVAAVSGIGAGVKAIEDSIYENSDEYKKKQEKERLETEYQRKLTLNSDSLSYSPIIEESKQLGKEYEKLGEEMDETKLAKFESNLRSLVEIFPELGSNISDSANILDSWKDIVDGAALSAEKIIQIKNLEATKDITDSNVKDVADQLQKELDEIDKISKSRDKISEFSRDDIHFDSQLTGNLEGPYEGEKKNVELTIADLRAELQALSDEFSNLSIANIPVNEDVSKFVESMTNLISALDGMPKDGYDFSSLQNLDLNQLSSQAVNIESAIKAIDDAVANNVISQETANAMKDPLEQALTSLQNKIDEFNKKNKVNTVGYHVEDDSDVAMSNIAGVPDGPDGKGFDDAYIGVQTEADNAKQEFDNVANGKYTAVIHVEYDFGKNKPEEEKPTETAVKQLEEELRQQSKNTVVQQPSTYAVPNIQPPVKSPVSQQTYVPPSTQIVNKPFVPNVNDLTSEGQVTLEKLEQEKSRLTSFWKSFVNELIKDPEHNIESVLDKLNATKDDLIKAINTNVTMDKYLDIEATMSDIQEILDAFFQLSTTVGEVKNNRYSSMAFNIKNAPRLAGTMSDVSRGPAPLNDNHIVADEVLKPSIVNWLDDNFYKSISGIDPTGKFYNGLKNIFASLGMDIEDYSSNAKTLFGLSEDPTKRDISLNGIYKQQIENMQGENSPYYYLLASKPNDFYPNRRLASVNELDYSIDDPETIAATKDILTYLYEYVLPNDKNYNKASYKNLDEFLADWDNQEGSFKNFAFTSDSDANQDALSYISSYFDKITDKDSSEYDDYQKYIKSKIDAAAKSAFDQLFGTDSSGNSIIKAFDQLDNGDTLKGVIKGIIETQHVGQSYSDWINTDNLNEVVALVDKEILEYVQDPDKYIQNKATEAFKQDPTNLVKTAIGMFDEINGTKSTADTLFKQIQAAIKGGSVTNLSDVFKLFSESEDGIFEDLSTVLMDDKKGVLGQVLKEFTDEDANIIDENGVGLKQFLIALASLTGAYTDAANEILPQIADNAKNYLTSRNETLYSDFSSLVGSSLAIKYKTGETLSPIESSYIDTIIGNASNGISGLTSMQQYEGMRTLFDLANSGNFDYGSIDSKVLSAYTSGSKVLDEYLSASSVLSSAGLDASKLKDITPYTDEFNQYNRVLKEAGTSVQTFLKVQQQLDQEFATAGITAINEYGDKTKEVASIVSNMKGTTEDVAQEQQKLNKLLSSATSNQYYRNQWRSGKRDKETYEAIAGMLNIDKGQIDVIGEDLINKMLDSLSNLDLSQIQTYGYAIGEMMTQSLQDAVANDTIDLTTAGIDVHNGPVTLNIAETLAKLGDVLDDETKALLQLLQQWGIDANTIITEEDGKIKARIQIKSVGSGRGGGQYRSGAGSSGNNGNNGNNNKKEKTPAEALTEAIKNRKSLWDHRIKMVQFEQTYYEQDDQLGNYGRMIEAENEIRKEMGPALEQNLKDLQAELAQTSQNTKEWYSLRDAILETEEAIEDNNNAIEANNKKLKQNEYEIHKRRVDLENLVRDEIKRRIEEYRNQVKGASDLENTILDIIKQRYKEQWEIVKEDIDKKKEALNEEKSLINERLQARKSAEDKATKYEQLAEYKKQLALIQMDRSRTREATELRKKIAELQGTIGWSVAEEEAKNQTDEIDQQIKAYDDYEKNGDEALERFLEDANNMKEEIKQIMNLNHDDLLNWLRTNSDEYQNSLENTRETMEFGWHDLYNQANGIIETFNEQVEKILTNQDTYIEYMKESSEYLNATKDAQANMVTDWMNTYDQWYKTLDRSAEHVHVDINLQSDGSVIESNDYSYGGNGSSYNASDASDYSDNQPYDITINGNSKPVKGYLTSEKMDSESDSNTINTFTSEKINNTFTAEKKQVYRKKIYLKYATTGDKSPVYFEGEGYTENDAVNDAYDKAVKWIQGNRQELVYYVLGPSGRYPQGYTASFGGQTYSAKTKDLAYNYLLKTFEASNIALTRYQDLYNGANSASYTWYKHGGLVDYTGPAWVDGTPSDPEAFLSAPDTKMIRELIDYLHYIPTPYMTHYDPSIFSGTNSSNIESIVVNINEASVSDDVDIENLANRIGEQFNRELEKQGFTTARYRFY